MSRFVEILEAHEREITVETFQQMLREMVEKLEAEEGHIEMTFPYFIEKKAPVSGVKSLMDYEVTFVGEIRKKAEQCFSMKVLVPVTSLCPCSKKISELRRAQPALARHDHRAAPTTSSGSRSWSTSPRSRPRASSTACSSAPTRSTSPSAPTTTRSSSRTWCATSPRCSTSTSASSATWSSRRTSSRSTTTAPTR